MNELIRRCVAGCVFIKDASRLAKAFRRDERGVVAIVFMLSMLPLVSLAGAAIDLSLMSRVKTQAQVAADTAAIASITENYLDYKQNMQSNVQKAEKAARDEFAAHVQLLNINNITHLSSAESKLVSSDQVQVRVCFEGEQPTSFLSILGFKSIPFSGCSEAVSAKPYYMNVYILVDASGSMGFGASQSDRATMHNLYQDWTDAGKPGASPQVPAWLNNSCAFLCHSVAPGVLPDGTIQPPGQPYLTAPANRKLFRTRYDVFKDALVMALDGAEKNAKFTDQFQFNVFKFSNYLTEVASLSSDFGYLKNQINSMELDREGAGTNFTYTMQKFASYIPKSGDGSSKDKAKNIVMVLSDGLESFIYELKNCDVTWNRGALDRCQKHGNYYSGDWKQDENITFRNTPKYQSHSWGMDDQSCKPIQETDAAILVLAAEVYEGNWADIGNANLRKCASEKRYAFTANSAEDVNKAINQMFGFVMSMPRFSYGGFTEANN